MRSIMVVASILALAACNAADSGRGESAKATGTAGQRSYQVGAFDSVSLGGHHNVIVTVGGAPSVRAEGDEGELADLEIVNRGSVLDIGSRSRHWTGRRHPLTIHVTVPALAKAAIGGSGDMRIDAVRGPRFEASIGGSGDIEIASLQVEDARFSVAGSGTIHAGAGQAQKTDISIAGSGNVDLAAVESRDSEVSVVGSGDASIRASQTATVSIMGSGDVNVAGSARCDVSKMGSGEVRCQS